MRRVLPGVALVLASPLWLHSMLMRLDFPTLERPMNAYSGFVSFGHMLTRGALSVNSDVLIIIIGMFLGCKSSKKMGKTSILQRKSLSLQERTEVCNKIK